MEENLKPQYDFDTIGGRELWLKNQEKFHNLFMEDSKQIEGDLISMEINRKLQPLKDEIEFLKNEILSLQNRIYD